MITVQIQADIIDQVTIDEVLNKLTLTEKQFIKPKEVIYDYKDFSFIEYNNESLTYIPPYIFRYKLAKCKSVLWDR